MTSPRLPRARAGRTWTTRAGALIAAALVLLFAVSRGTDTAQGQTPQFTSLEEAVAAGHLDEGVLDALRANGEVDALIVLAESRVRTRAEDARSQRGQSLDDPATLAEKRREFAALKQQALAAANGAASVLRDYEQFGVQHLRFQGEEALLAMLNRPQVQAVRQNRSHKVRLGSSLQLINQPTAQANGKIGSNTAVAILDTGVDYGRSAFGPCSAVNVPANVCKVAFAGDFAGNDNALDDHGHGTNVAAIALGVAPGTKVLSLDVFDGDYAWDTDIIQALNWVVQNRATYNIASANLSLGDGEFWTSQCSGSSYDSAFANLRAAGVLPVVAAGNDAYANSDPFGNHVFTNGISAPACAPGAVRVGAVYDGSISGSLSYGGNPPECTDSAIVANKITCFSQSAPILSILAPGAQVTAGGYTMYGTSQATPHVAGAVAVLRGHCASATASTIQNALTSSGPTITDSRNSVSVRRLEVWAAVQALSCPATPTPTATATKTPTSSATAPATTTATVPPGGCTRVCPPGQTPVATPSATVTATATKTATATATTPPSCGRVCSPGQTPTTSPTATATNPSGCGRSWCP
jgi:hypothetical protein